MVATSEGAVADAPETKAEEGKKKGRQDKRARYPVPEGKLESVPADYDPKVHRTLVKTDFKDDSFWYDWRAGVLEEKAKNYRAQAEAVRSLGTVEDRKRAAALLRFQAKADALTKQLAAEGIDVNKILAGMSGGENGSKE